MNQEQCIKEFGNEHVCKVALNSNLKGEKLSVFLEMFKQRFSKESDEGYIQEWVDRFQRNGGFSAWSHADEDTEKAILSAEKKFGEAIPKTDVVEFFKQRFKKSPSEDKAYFNEWKERFDKGHPTSRMDEESLAIYNKLAGLTCNSCRRGK